MGVDIEKMQAISRLHHQLKEIQFIAVLKKRKPRPYKKRAKKAKVRKMRPKPQIDWEKVREFATQR